MHVYVYVYINHVKVYTYMIWANCNVSMLSNGTNTQSVRMGVGQLLQVRTPTKDGFAPLHFADTSDMLDFGFASVHMVEFHN